MARSGGNRPRQSDLRRAQSSAYYAMFHLLAKTCADLLVGGSSSNRSEQAWRQVYRSLNHGESKNACMNAKVVARFPLEIREFAKIYVALQEERHAADYDPSARLLRSGVETNIALAEDTMREFAKSPAKDRRAFAAHVLFRQR